FRTNLTKEEFISNLKKINVAMIGQSETIAPADKKFYALRDVTGTIESIPLIASSIMSKKLAEGIDGLVLDVKTGSGAFMKKERDAVLLAKVMAAIGKKMGKDVVALITDMDQPLGKTIGNSLEIKECIDVLKGRGTQDLVDITLELGAYMLKLAGEVNNAAKGRDVLKRHLSNGSAYERFKDMVSCMLGAGRERIEDKIDPAVGIVLDKKIGDSIKKGERFAALYYNSEEKMAEAYERLQAAIFISNKRPREKGLIKRVIMA
ncbi:MAG: hypothetical protein HZC10_01805, partial [Nitrospirae bacterium]|nr:hypothetical protein [Nitrospirota bacterium]